MNSQLQCCCQNQHAKNGEIHSFRQGVKIRVRESHDLTFPSSSLRGANLTMSKGPNGTARRWL